jgi:hypothetical protein
VISLSRPVRRCHDTQGGGQFQESWQLFFYFYLDLKFELLAVPCRRGGYTLEAL